MYCSNSVSLVEALTANVDRYSVIVAPACTPSVVKDITAS